MRTRMPAVAILVGLVLTLASAPAGAGIDPDAATGFVARLNAARSDAGLAPLAVAGDLAEVAHRHAVRMADAASLYHNPDLGSEVPGWAKVGENVGRGPSVDAIHEALWGSPSHRANLLDAAFSEVGVAVESRDGHLWVAQVFRRPQRSVPDAPPVPAESAVEVAGAAVEPALAMPVPTPAATVADAAPASPAPSGLDHTTIMLARLEAAEQAIAVSDLLAP